MSGSKEGGLTLTIYGNYFDDRAPYTAPRAYIGGDAETQCSQRQTTIKSTHKIEKFPKFCCC